MYLYRPCGIERQATADTQGQVPARAGEALDEPIRDRIAFEIDPDDRDRPRRAHGRGERPRAPGEDEINLESDQVRGEGGEEINPAVRVSVLEGDVVSLDVS